MRETIHLVSRRDFWPIARAVSEPLREWWLRSTKREGERENLKRIDGRVRELLRESPRRRRELIEVLGGDRHVWAGVGLWTPLVRVPPSGTWAAPRADLYATAEDWIGPEPSTTTHDAVLHLVRRYLGAFGPASRRDIQSFTGLPLSTIDAAIEKLAIRRFATEAGERLVDIRGGPLPSDDTPAPVRFLPTWDATLLVHARRTQILPERYRSRVFGVRTPFSFPTFLVDGHVAGTWREDRRKILLEPFEPLPRRVRRELEDEARRLSALYR